jgi:hypothetical protein
MAGLKRREVVGQMPPEVQRRVARSGLSARQVDWYAGRQNIAGAEDTLDETPDNLRSATATIRAAHDDEHETAAATLVKAVASLCHAVFWRLRGGLSRSY